MANKIDFPHRLVGDVMGSRGECKKSLYTQAWAIQRATTVAAS
jgi:hypothetical protein